MTNTTTTYDFTTDEGCAAFRNDILSDTMEVLDTIYDGNVFGTQNAWHGIDLQVADTDRVVRLSFEDILVHVTILDTRGVNYGDARFSGCMATAEFLATAIKQALEDQ